jgi:hypothetical protein
MIPNDLRFAVDYVASVVSLKQRFYPRTHPSIHNICLSWQIRLIDGYAVADHVWTKAVLASKVTGEKLKRRSLGGAWEVQLKVY